MGEPSICVCETVRFGFPNVNEYICMLSRSWPNFQLQGRFFLVTAANKSLTEYSFPIRDMKEICCLYRKISLKKRVLLDQSKKVTSQ